MNETMILPPPVLQPANAPVGKWQREYDAFQRLLPQLLTTYHGKYVAIHDGRVVAEGDNRIEVALNALRNVGNVDIHVGYVSEQADRVYRSGVRREVKRSKSDS